MRIIEKLVHRFGLRTPLVVVLLAASCWLVGCTNSKPEEESSQASQQKSEQPSADRPPIFQDVSDRCGLHFQHNVGDLGKYHFPDIMVAGCGVIDFDRDGLLDIITIDSGNIEDVFSGKFDNRKQGRNRIFRQSQPGSFEDVTAELQLADSGYGCGVAVGDVNNDGFDDIYFANFGSDKLLVNVKGARFQDLTVESGIQNPSWGSSATMLDFDRDGRLDIFVTNYVSYLAETNCANAGDAEDFCSPRVFEKTVDKLFRNISQDGQVRFEDVSVQVGITAKKGPGLGVIARDFNGDGYLDLYVANDGWENFLWINEEGKKFSDQAGKLGCAMSLKGDAQAGMGVDAEDLNGDGVLDIVVTHLDGETNAAYLGSLSAGQLFYTESGGTLGVQKISKPMTGFGIALADLDLDGDLDMLTANGRVTRKTRIPSKSFWSDYAEQNQLALNDGHGKYVEYQSVSDGFLQEVAVSRGLAILDYDNDGRLDCLVSSTGSRIRLYQNIFQSDSNWIGFRVTDPSLGGRVALGAKIELTFDSGKTLTRMVRNDGSYQSAHDSRVHFGLGDAKIRNAKIQSAKIRNAKVIWLDGTVEEIKVDRLNRYYWVQKQAGSSELHSDKQSR